MTNVTRYINAPENCDGNNYEDLVKYANFTPSSDKVMRLCTDREPRFLCVDYLS